MDDILAVVLRIVFLLVGVSSSADLSVDGKLSSIKMHRRCVESVEYLAVKRGIGRSCNC